LFAILFYKIFSRKRRQYYSN